MAASWAASGMSMLPGLAPRPQHYIIKKKDHTEEVNSTSNALFVFVRDCENTKVPIKGKVGKVTIESGDGIEITVPDIIVSGTLEVIKSNNVTIRVKDLAEIPTIQVDDSTGVTIEIERRSQIEKVYFIRCKNLKLLLNGQKVGDQADATLQYEISTTDDRANIQQIAHWSSATADADFVTETVVRDGIYPTTAQMKKAADLREKEALHRMAEMLVEGFQISKPGERSKSIAQNKDSQLDLPD